MGKKIITIVLVIVAIIVSALTVYGTNVNGEEPGSVSDPLVSKSYVDQKINDVLTLLNQYKEQKLSDKQSDKQNKTDTINSEELEQKIDLLVQLRLQEMLKQNKINLEVKPQVFEPILVKKGQKVIGKKSTEIILRSGKALVISSKSGGVQDVTKGVDLKNKEAVPKYHLLIIPRTDGRGIQLEEDSWIMIKGEYDIIEG